MSVQDFFEFPWQGVAGFIAVTVFGALWVPKLGDFIIKKIQNILGITALITMILNHVHRGGKVEIDDD